VTAIGVILCGGAGRRMGGNKALVELDGLPLLHYPVAALREVLEDVVVVCKQDTPLPDLGEGIEVWCEHEAEQHPLVGVAAALRQAKPRPILVCAGDMPLVDSDSLRALLNAPAPASAVVARASGRVQPLLARYATEVLPTLESRAPDEAMTTVIERLDPLFIDVPERAVFNVNAPEDLLLAEREGVGGDA
jgi:molybdopterin-guanine dinucleotide biosynthesis protein A